MEKPSRKYHHGDLQRAFVAEAARIVESEGLAALTLREISRRLGVSHAASTNHFADKAALLAEVAADGFEQLAAALEAAMAARPARRRLANSGRAYVDFALARPGHFRVMFGSEAASPARCARLGVASQRAFAILEHAVIDAMPSARARSQERVREAVFLAWSTVHGAAMLLLDRALVPTRNPGGARALVDAAAETVARAIAGEPTASSTARQRARDEPA